MITAYLSEYPALQKKIIVKANADLLQDAVWIDVLHPSVKDNKLLQAHLNLNIPTREEMQEIEPSSRLYKEDNALFMTATMLANSDTNEPKTDAVTFILTSKQLVTLRHLEPKSILLFDSKIGQLTLNQQTANNILIGLLESAIDRIADILEGIGHQLDESSQTIFRSEPVRKTRTNFQHILQNIGANGDLSMKARESLISFNRLAAFFEQNGRFEIGNEQPLNTLMKDIAMLNNYIGFISNQVNFLLNAALGMINIQQNNIIRIFTIASVMFLPPTLIASIYGMNFKNMPELSWTLGYPVAIAIMLLTALLPFLYFKYKKWL